MSDTQRYEVVLKELCALLATMPDFAGRVIMIGGQVLALEARSRGGDGQLMIDTQVGELLDRGFSFEADLLLDFEGLAATDHFETRLRDRGYKKKSGFAWARVVEGYEVELEFFRAEEASEGIAPVRTTPVPGGEAAIARARELTVQVPGGKLQILVPDPVGYLTMKVRAKLEKRPKNTKDCFDIYGYVTLIGIDEVAAAIVNAGAEGTTLMNQLDELFGDEEALGVEDVLAFVPDMYGDQYMLVRRAVMECFAELKRSVGER